jgi:hypothetical protein
MTDAHPPFITDNPLVKPHQLCKCCQTLAGELFRIVPGMKKNDSDIICEHYKNPQDLIDGTLGGCHICNIVCGQHRLRGDNQSWLQFSTPDDTSDEQASRMKTITQTTLDTKYGTSVSTNFTISVKSNCNSFDTCFNLDYGDLVSPLVGAYTEAQLSTRVFSDAHVHLIQEWLNACTDRAQHPACNTTAEFRRPTRLLELDHYLDQGGGFDQQDVRLVEGKSSAGRYAAFSYCWGVVQQPKLLQTNLRQFQENIAFGELSQVARDAITVCRQLSIPYLWIDALCIIQGEDGDFVTEAPRMQDVYAGSTLTIVAADSKDSTEAFLVNRNPLPWLSCLLESQSETRTGVRYRVQPKMSYINEPGKYHVDTRAWFFQERFMSPRSVYFGQKGIHWECRQGYACEHEEEIESRYPHDNLKAEHARLRAKSLQGKSEVHLMWSEVLETYSGMCLSHSEDVLVAISGIASMFEVELGSKSTYGLWVDFLLLGLLWWQDVHDPDEYPWVYNASAKYLPSWSWTSRHGNPMSTLFTLLHGADCYYSADLISWPSDAAFDIRFLQGPQDLRLCIKGYLTSYTATGLKEKYIDDGSSLVTRTYYPDNGVSETNLFCLLIFACQHQIGGNIRDGYYEKYGLVLTPINMKEHLYRRVGLYVEKDYDAYFGIAPESSSWVQGRFPVHLWAPLGEMQKVYIV